VNIVAYVVAMLLGLSHVTEDSGTQGDF